MLRATTKCKKLYSAAFNFKKKNSNDKGKFAKCSHAKEFDFSKSFPLTLFSGT